MKNKRYDLYNLFSSERAVKLDVLRKRRKKQLVISTIALSIMLLVCVIVVSVAVYKNKDEEVVPAIAETTTTNPFESIYYYESDKYDRYVDYSIKHPELSIEDVVWRVNSYLDYEFYTHDIPADTSSPYVIVNKYYKVPDDYAPDNLVTADGHQMTAETADAYFKMKNAAAEEGKTIVVVSGFRTVEYQRNLYNSYLETDTLENVDSYSARAGYSEHHTGMAIDLFGSFGSLRDFINTPESQWVYDNAYKYGFIVRYWTDIEDLTGYEDEPWHLRYVGYEVAKDMHDKGIRCFEEYKVKYIDH